MRVRSREMKLGNNFDFPEPAFQLTRRANGSCDLRPAPFPPTCSAGDAEICDPPEVLYGSCLQCMTLAPSTRFLWDAARGVCVAPIVDDVFGVHDVRIEGLSRPSVTVINVGYLLLWGFYHQRECSVETLAKVGLFDLSHKVCFVSLLS